MDYSGIIFNETIIDAMKKVLVEDYSRMCDAALHVLSTVNTMGELVNKVSEVDAQHLNAMLDILSKLSDDDRLKKSAETIKNMFQTSFNALTSLKENSDALTALTNADEKLELKKEKFKEVAVRRKKDDPPVKGVITPRAKERIVPPGTKGKKPITRQMKHPTCIKCQTILESRREYKKIAGKILCKSCIDKLIEGDVSD